MSKGYVYVLVNEYMPGLVKVGRTCREVEQRAEELFQTGVPSPFTVWYFALCPDCIAVEAAVHRELIEHRVSDNREFFEVGPEVAVRAVMRAQEEQVGEWLDEFIPDSVAIHVDMLVDPSLIAEAAGGLDEHPFLIADAMRALTPEEIRPALERVKAERKAEREWLSVVRAAE